MITFKQQWRSEGRGGVTGWVWVHPGVQVFLGHPFKILNRRRLNHSYRLWISIKWFDFTDPPSANFSRPTEISIPIFFVGNLKRRGKLHLSFMPGEATILWQITTPHPHPSHESTEKVLLSPYSRTRRNKNQVKNDAKNLSRFFNLI